MPIPIKVFLLGHYPPCTQHSIKAICDSETCVRYKSRKKTYFLNPPCPISISTDRTQCQRESKKNMWEELVLHTSNVETGLTITFIKGVA